MRSEEDWETDPDFVNDISEKESRWGSKTVEGSGLQGAVDMEAVRQEAIQGDLERKARSMKADSQPSFGYGGKFGVMADRMDKTAESWDYKGVTEKHPSQVDYSYGFGGKFGIQKDRQDKCALDWQNREKLATHDSQKSVKVNVKGKVSHEWLNSHGGKDAPTPVKKSPIHLPTAHNGAIKVQSKKTEKNRAEVNRPPTPEVYKSAKEALNEELSLCKASSLRDKFEQLAMRDQKVLGGHPMVGKSTAYKKQLENDQPSVKRTEAVVGPAVSLPVAAESATDQPVLSIPPPNPITMVNNNNESSDESATGADDWDDDYNAQSVHTARYQNVQDQVNAGYGQNFEGQQQQHDYSHAETDHISQASLRPQDPVEVHPLGEPEHPMADTGVRAVALYDYKAGDDDEISFEPDDIISNIDMVDTDWWRGSCRGRYGLFPANYVELCP